MKYSKHLHLIVIQNISEEKETKPETEKISAKFKQMILPIKKIPKY